MTDSGFAAQIAIGPRVRKSPYFDATRRWGAKGFSIYNHTLLPIWYTDAIDEYWKLLKTVTLWDVGCQRQVEISGPDAARFTQYLTPRNLSSCAVEQCKYVLLTNQAGGIVNDAVLYRLAEDRFWFSPGDGDTLLWAMGAAVSSGMDVTVREPDVWPMQLQGPSSIHVARKLFGDWVEELGFYRLRQTELDGIPLVLTRTGWSGEFGFEILPHSSDRGDELWEMIMAAGADWDIAAICPSSIRSIEAGNLDYRSDITLDDNPFTLGYERLVDLEQEADFIGKAALKRIAAEGVRRRLVGVEIDCDPLPRLNEEWLPVVDGDEQIGRITRCIHSPRLEKNIGFANIPVALADEGSTFTVRGPFGDAQATVIPTPFVQRVKSAG